MARRPLAAALVLGASALALTGCIPMPPAIPAAPTGSPIEPADPVDTTEATEPAEPSETGSSEEPSEPAPGAYDFTVDDGAGDVWSFSVTSLEEDPPMQSGEPEAGTYFVGILFDAEHLEGSFGFSSSFDIFVVGSDGVEYDWRDTIAVTAENDVFYADEAGFTQARAVVQLPEGVEPAHVILRSAYGYPEVPETVIDVE